MRGLLLFIAGVLCGGAAVAWLLVGRGVQAPAPIEQTLPMPEVPVDSATGREPGADDLVLIPPHPDQGPHPELGIDPLDRVPVPSPGVPPIDPAPGALPTGPDLPGASPQAPAPPDPAVLAALRRMDLLMPVQGVEPRQLSDTYSDARGESRSHDAIDIMAPTGRPVRAVTDGRIVKLFESVPGGLTLYQFDAKDQVAFYYAHLDRYAEGVTEGQQVKRGDLIGYVGSTGNADVSAPHLHFAIFVLGPEKKWHQGTAVNPYPMLMRASTDPGAP